MKLIKKSLIAIIATLFMAVGLLPVPAFADMEFSVSPMNQRIILTPGEDYSGTLEVISPAYNQDTFYYKLSVEPYFVDENHEPIFENNGDYNQIVDWVELESETGSVEPNEAAHINFTVHTPATAPAGGQYAIIRVTSDYEKHPSGIESSLNIQNIMSIAHILYAEVAGETNRGGEIVDIKVPSFLFSSNITGTATIKNLGNVHSDATYTLQVYPLFSNEEIYTNEEEPTSNIILAEATRTAVINWEETPSIGIFHVVFNADFEGAHSKVDKYVIICPLWLLFLILLAIFLIIFRILSTKKKSHPEK